MFVFFFLLRWSKLSNTFLALVTIFLNRVDCGPWVSLSLVKKKLSTPEQKQPWWWYGGMVVGTVGLWPNDANFSSSKCQVLDSIKGHFKVPEWINKLQPSDTWTKGHYANGHFKTRHRRSRNSFSTPTRFEKFSTELTEQKRTWCSDFFWNNICACARVGWMAG